MCGAPSIAPWSSALLYMPRLSPTCRCAFLTPLWAGLWGGNMPSPPPESPTQGLTGLVGLIPQLTWTPLGCGHNLLINTPRTGFLPFHISSLSSAPWGYLPNQLLEFRSSGSASGDPKLRMLFGALGKSHHGALVQTLLKPGVFPSSWKF